MLIYCVRVGVRETSEGANVAYNLYADVPVVCISERSGECAVANSRFVIRVRDSIFAVSTVHTSTLYAFVQSYRARYLRKCESATEKQGKCYRFIGTFMHSFIVILNDIDIDINKYDSPFSIS